MGIEIRGAEDEGEIRRAYELSSYIFGSSQEESWGRKRHCLRYDKVKDPGEVIIAMEKGRIIGTLRIVGRRNLFLGSLLKTGGITNVCVDPAYQGKGVGRGLINKSIEFMRERKYPLSIVVARRAVDGFYAKYGFVGTGIFCDLSLSDRKPAKNYRINKNNFQKGFKRKFTEKYSVMYDLIYAKVPVSFYRPGSWWDEFDLKNKYKIKKRDFVNVIEENKLIGYFILYKNKIIEASFCPERLECFSKALISYFMQNKISGPVVSVSPLHPCSEYLMNNFNHTLSVRRVLDGGHMLRIIDPFQIEKAVLKFININCREFVPIQRSLTEKRVRNLFNCYRKAEGHEQALKISGFLTIGSANPVQEKIKKNILHSWGLLDEF